jgi:hypothetical protein
MIFDMYDDHTAKGHLFFKKTTARTNFSDGGVTAARPSSKKPPKTSGGVITRLTVAHSCPTTTLYNQLTLLAHLAAAWCI